MQSYEIRDKFLKFFEKRGHKIIPSSSLVPENDPSVLFTTAGMQQFKPYYLGEPSPYGKSVTSVQKCMRTSDIEEVGDDTHLTFFEMLGNFSFGGYWKSEAIEYAHEFITKELGLTIDYVSVFGGEDTIPEDTESEQIWKSIDKDIKIKKFGKADNFWGPTGDEGPCGPTTEIYINGVEVWNVVFNEYHKSKDGKYTPLEAKGIDTGMGLERLLVQVQNKNNIYETDLFQTMFDSLKKDQVSLSDYDEKSARIVLDHTRTSIFLIADGVVPGEKKREFVLRRLIRRAFDNIREMNFEEETMVNIVGDFVKIYGGIYSKLKNENIKKVLSDEITQYISILKKGLQKIIQTPDLKNYSPEEFAKFLFNLRQSEGMPFSVAIEEIKKHHNLVTSDQVRELFENLIKEHQKLSQTSSAGMFKGGLANHEEKTIRLHTAHHLLLAALQAVVDPKIKQRGSNITEERLRMDFACDHKLTDEEKKKVEDWVNDKIKQGLNVVKREMPLAEAEKLGAEMEFGAKYPDTVSVYFIEDSAGNHTSKEFCGGPHVSNTGELGSFKIQKEEAVSAGVRRIKAVLV